MISLQLEPSPADSCSFHPSLFHVLAASAASYPCNFSFNGNIRDGETGREFTVLFRVWKLKIQPSKTSLRVNRPLLYFLFFLLLLSSSLSFLSPLFYFVFFCFVLLFLFVLFCFGLAWFHPIWSRLVRFYPVLTGIFLGLSPFIRFYPV